MFESSPPEEPLHAFVHHSAMVALSFDPRLAVELRPGIERRARTALAVLVEDCLPQARIDGQADVVIEAGCAGPFFGTGASCFVLGIGAGGTNWEQKKRVEAKALFERLRDFGAGALSEITPPFAAVYRTQPLGPLYAATDTSGLFHLYACQGEGWSACSSSCLLLGSLLGQGLDLEAMGIYSQLGFYLGAQTPLRGVRRLVHGESCRLAEGRLSVEVYARPRARLPMFRSFKEATDAGVEAVHSAVGALTEAHDTVGISLSGGLDSRLVLAAIETERRASLGVVTLHSPGNGDRAVVEQLAETCNFTPKVVDISAFPSGLADGLARGASLRRGHCANPLTTAVWEWAESKLPATPRLHGQNGEFARGFYYPGQPLRGGVTVSRVEGLMRWRLLVAESVTPRVFARSFRDELRVNVRDSLVKTMQGLGDLWPEVLDEFYLQQRMECWVGAEMSRTSTRRVDLSPFFDPRFLDWARRCPAAIKRNSRIVSTVLEALDPGLARAPLEGRPSPHELSRNSARVRVQAAWTFASKAARKLRRRLGAAADAPVGAPAVQSALLEHGRFLLGRAAAVDLFDPGTLEEVMAGRFSTDVATLGFLLNVEWTLEFLDHVQSVA